MPSRTDIILIVVIFTLLAGYAIDDLSLWIQPIFETWFWHVVIAIFLVVAFMAMLIVVFMIWVCSLRHKSDDQHQDGV